MCFSLIYAQWIASKNTNRRMNASEINEKKVVVPFKELVVDLMKNSVDWNYARM